MEKMQRHSRKREAILKVMRGTTDHPSAEWVYAKLKPEFPDLSLGTVYRNISWFQETGDIVHIANVNGQERYDADISMHAHFICARCGDIQDVGISVDSSFIQITEEVTGARVNVAQLLFSGLCAKCGSPRAI